MKSTVSNNGTQVTVRTGDLVTGFAVASPAPSSGRSIPQGGGESWMVN